MFASTEPSGFPPAILSRLQRFDVRRLTVAEIEGKLRRILAADGRAADAAAIRLIARLAAGGMRDAESMLDQLLSAAPERIDESHVRELLGLADAEAVERLHRPLVRGDAASRAWPCSTQLEERGRDVRALLDQVVEAIRAGARRRAGHDPDRAATIPAALAAAARRLAAIDPNRAGIGGLRFQLELALFACRRRRPGHPGPRPRHHVAGRRRAAARRHPRRRRALLSSSPPHPRGQDHSTDQPASVGPTDVGHPPGDRRPTRGESKANAGADRRHSRAAGPRTAHPARAATRDPRPRRRLPEEPRLSTSSWRPGRPSSPS